jgi:curved DNA-binding protein CbpA
MLHPKPANLPEPSATGVLAKKPLAHLLIYAVDRKLSGTFELADETGTSVQVVVIDGNVARVGTSDSVTFLGHVLYENGYIDDAQLSTSLAEVAATKRLHGQVLLSQKLITLPQLAEGLRQQRARKLQHAFSLGPRTSFAFYTDVDLVGERPNDVEPMDSLTCLWRGVREHPSWDHVRATITRVGGRAVRLREGLTDAASLARLGLEHGEIQAIECLRVKACSIPELAIVGGLTIQATDLLAYFLIISKLVEVTDRIDTSSMTPPASSRIPILNTPGGAFASGEYARKISFSMTAVTPDAGKLRIPSPVPSRVPSPMPGRLPSPMPGRLMPPPMNPSSIPPGRATGTSTGTGTGTDGPPSAPGTSSSIPARKMTPVPGSVAPQSASSPPGSGTAPPPSSDTARRTSILERAKWIDKEDYFKMLMVSREAMTEEIREAFLRAAKVWHPEALPASLADVKIECDRVFRKITEAYETLADPVKRRQYERAIGNKIRESAEADHILSEAQMHLTLGDRAQAEVLARKALVASQGMPDATALLVYLEATDPRRGTLEHLRASLKMIDMAITKDPLCKRGHFYRAEIKKRLEDHEGAIRDLRTAVANDPHDPEPERELLVYEKKVREGVIQIRSLSPSGGVKKSESFLDRLRKK